MKKAASEFAILFVLSFVLRIMLFYPSFIQGGDLGQFTTFAREVYLAGGAIPALNTLYFPGTQFIYPPVLSLATGGLLLLHSGGFAPYAAMRAELIMAAVASSGTSVLVYNLGRKDCNGWKNSIVFSLALFFMPDLSALSWGGDPAVVAEFLVLLMLFFMERSSKGWKWAIAAAACSILVAFTHDLTFFLMTLTLILILVYDLIRKGVRVVHMDLAVLVAGSAAGVVWWYPRAGFVKGALLATGSSGYGSINPASSALPFIYVFLPFAAAVVAILLYTLLTTDLKLSKVKWDPFVLALMASLIFIPFILRSPTLGARILYYGIVFGAIVTVRLFSSAGEIKNGRKAQFSLGKRKVAIGVALLVAVMAVSVPLQAASAYQGVVHYRSGYYQYDPALLQWGESNFGNSTVVAPNIGNYISAVDGVPVIVYGNFLVGGGQIGQRNAAASIISDPGSSLSLQYLSQYNIGYVVVTETAAISNPGLFPAGMYSAVFQDSHYVVEKYTGSQA